MLSTKNALYVKAFLHINCIYTNFQEGNESKLLISLEHSSDN